MIKIIKRFMSFFIELFVRVKSIFKLLKNKSFLSEKSYFTECADRRKGRFAIFKDLLSWILKYGDINEFYYL